MGGMAIEFLGFFAAAASIFVYVSSTMIPLRIAAVVANALFAFYFYFRGVYPQCALNLILLPLNLYRLNQMRGLVRAVKNASREDFDFEWLRPFMKPRKVKAFWMPDGYKDLVADTEAPRARMVAALDEIFAARKIDQNLVAR